MPLNLIHRKDSPNWWIRGSVRGIAVNESTKVTDRETADIIRIVREKTLLDESIFGRKIDVTFNDAADSYPQGGGSTRFLDRLRAALGSKC
jgi:hypothetical protein